MNCQQSAVLIERVLADELPTAARAELEAHLSACAPCRARARDFAQLEGLLREMPREAVSPQLAARVQQRVRAQLLQQRIGHAWPFAIGTTISLLLFVWLASETWLALQDRALWEMVNWFVNVPDILWQHPSDVLAAFADFAPLGGLAFTLASAISSGWLGMHLVQELRRPTGTGHSVRQLSVK